MEHIKTFLNNVRLALAYVLLPASHSITRTRVLERMDAVLDAADHFSETVRKRGPVLDTNSELALYRMEWALEDLEVEEDFGA